LRKKQSIEFISCPTCGRIEIDLIELTKQVKKRLSHIKKPIKVAIMGCVVNALGEAREADLAIAGGRHFGLIIEKGKIVKKVKEDGLLDSFVEQVEKYVEKQP
jgi:(E)-4-hydroxy-3-methylbut-2-enyl-diphosphate synthase